MVVHELHHQYAACVYKKIKEEWPYYRQLIAHNKCRHLYACSDASIDNCHHLQTPGGGCAIASGGNNYGTSKFSKITR